MPDPPGGRRGLPPRLYVVLVLRSTAYLGSFAGAITMLLLGYPLSVAVGVATVIALGSARAARQLSAGLLPMTPAHPAQAEVDRGWTSLVLAGLLSALMRIKLVPIGLVPDGLLVLLRTAR